MTTTKTPAASRAGTVLATRPLMGWRTVDLLTVAFLGVAFGVAYWGYGLLYNGPISALGLAFQPLFGLFVGFWFIAGVVGGLVVRRPGAAIACELIAATVSALFGNQWGVTTVVSGLAQGIGAELAFAIFAYKAFGPAVALLSGALSAPLEWIYEIYWYFVDWTWAWKLAYLPLMVVSGVVVAGLGGWLLTRALAQAGALNPFPPGQEVLERRAV
ncbi:MULTISPECIES: ECF transporter S component [Janibacter]|uniref:ECF transporter S component n=1 Tax=Janibacter indicus TaxID=857417 RepID=A0A1W1YLG9_9MICO|nr:MULTISPECIES: ECF transporter S component [Janibacter]QNF94014.1 ECF transporter S component [Janibacter sp. YB324]QOK22619.1 ECF transporter S component [Janibacter indicus]SMC37045.1 energy-coupling factor transport system substrate-specific component [Janibacter indicus]